MTSKRDRSGEREANRVRMCRWYRDHPAEAAANKRRRRAENLETIREQTRESVRRWRAAHPEAQRKAAERHQHIRRARKRANGVFAIIDRDWRRLLHRYRNACAYCGSGGLLSHDHVVPLVRGGRHSIGNLLPACGPCNRSKNRRLLIEWRTA